MKYEKLALDIKIARTKKGWTIVDLSNKSGVSTTSIWELENCKRKTYKDTIKKICVVLNLKPEKYFK